MTNSSAAVGVAVDNRRPTVVRWLVSDLLEPPPEPIVVAEELQDHVLFEGLSLEAVARIEESPDQFPGVQVIHASRRVYPAATMAAHLIGYVGPADDNWKRCVGHGGEQRRQRSR